ncbi:uncharacterized protein LOC105190484 [Harpegnathos saltator]|uniref:uncharacterized protein LOC105190484 n=1 Tax=Harpegnathos saltator TaxID=610380 RepID=UPI00058EFE37|nr:uncharacterized protein LOC105190484 [Harpegnathos saltator]
MLRKRTRPLPPATPLRKAVTGWSPRSIAAPPLPGPQRTTEPQRSVKHPHGSPAVTKVGAPEAAKRTAAKAPAAATCATTVVAAEPTVVAALPRRSHVSTETLASPGGDYPERRSEVTLRTWRQRPISLPERALTRPPAHYLITGDQRLKRRQSYPRLRGLPPSLWGRKVANAATQTTSPARVHRGTSPRTPPGDTPHWSEDSSKEDTPEPPRNGPIRVTITEPHIAYCERFCI